MEKKKVKKKVRSVKKKISTKKKSSTIKRSSVKKRVGSQNSPKSAPEKVNTINTEKMLIENFVSLQKVMVNLSVKFDNVSNQISKLLELFELSAKSLAEKDFSLGKGGDDTKKVIEKLEGVLDQNKVLAKGLALLHEPQSEQGSFKSPVQGFNPESSTESAKELPQIEPPVASAPSQAMPEQNPPEGYQPSISSQPQTFKQLPEA